MPAMKFTKMHGLGNDYVYVDLFTERVEDPRSLARRISDRHTGVGADGLILIGPSGIADLRMEMYNADGSRGEMCGNGIRCVARYAVDHGRAAGPTLRIETDCGVKAAECLVDGDGLRLVRIDMGRPDLAARAIPTTIPAERVINHPLRIAGATHLVTCVSMGNPHAVVFTEELDSVGLEAIGPAFEHAQQFPRGINVHFVQINSRAEVTMKTWERGSGVTRACGTGACAVCVAGAVTGRTDRRITAQLPGGRLFIEWAGSDQVYMTGPAVEVFSGVWPDGRLAK